MTHVIGYTYRADNYCPACVVRLLNSEGRLAPGSYGMSAEESLDQLAGVEGIEREDEWTFDSGDFPKVILEGTDETNQCGTCGTYLSGGPRYVATMNTPGYLPWGDEPATFETADDAWEYLRDERARQEEDADDGFDEYSDTVGELSEQDGPGTVYGDTPGYDGTHDLGIAYSVSIAEED